MDSAFWDAGSYLHRCPGNVTFCPVDAEAVGSLRAAPGRPDYLRTWLDGVGVEGRGWAVKM